MAVIKEVEVAIVVDDEEIQEYHPPPEDTSEDAIYLSSDTQVRYIQGIPDANFQIECKIREGFRFGGADLLTFCVNIDGTRFRGRCCHKECYQELDVWSSRIHGVKETASSGCGQQLRRFRWNNLSSIDHDYRQEDKERYQNLGSIKVEVWKRRDIGMDGTLVRVKDFATGPVSEKAIKGAAIDMRASLDPPQPCRNSILRHGANIENKPYAVFVFKYRSKEALQAVGILERPEMPQPLEERDVETMSPDELKELARRLKAAQEAQRIKFKKENADANLARLAELKRNRDSGHNDEDEVNFLGERPVKRICSTVAVLDDSD
ncbi:hypothetical protein Z517_00715 [Fonsecaea pedrosoi CBS 271.37]|uniref:DUF7918 domain-containing protein n=1 Tax=Fonsecaea pedrosoi CBS 271.37 TaxID=1442368 RepID=A0A0D2H376_9EURO|nr:uncharacterized protein Z517_00715 [Fonsecaea pedrosoi CBS 271.37]KIW85325.1 hypothetical protein Z517_00715 [Fonsecaea pedrosoi CBS 271.37]